MIHHALRPAMLLTTCLLLLASVRSIHAASTDEQLATVAKTLNGQLQGRSLRRLAVSEFVTLGGEHTSLTRYITDKLTTQLVAQSGTLEIIDRSQISTVLAEHKLSESGLLDPTTVRKLGKFAGVDAVLVGVITTLSASADVNVKVLDVETARIHAALSVRIESPDVLELTGSSSQAMPEAPVTGVSRALTSAATANPFYANEFVRIELESIGVSDSLDSITFTLSFQSKLAAAPLYIGAQCCHGEWLRVVDNNGRMWKSDQWNLTSLPTELDAKFSEISPGSKIYVSARIKPYQDGRRSEGGNVVPRAISITGAMLRRTEAGERVAKEKVFSRREVSSPFTFGIPAIAVGRARAYLGLVFKTDTTGSDLSRVRATNGLVIRSVNSGGAAHAAGIQPGDVLEKIDGALVRNGESVAALMARKKPGEHVVLLINRSGVRFEARVRLSDTPDTTPP